MRWNTQVSVGKRVILSLSLLFVLSIPLYSQEIVREPNILVYTHSGDEVLGESLKTYFDTTAADHLQKEGLNAVIIEEAASLSDLLKSAAWVGAFFLVEIIHTSEEGTYVFEMNAYSTWDEVRIVSRQLTGSGGDEQAADYFPVMNEVVEVINEYLQTEEVQTLIAELEAEVEVFDPQEDSAEEETEVETIQEESEVPSEEKPSEDTSPAQSQTDITEELEKKPPGQFTLSLEGAPFFAVGEVASLFPVGLDLSLLGGYNVNTKIGTLNLGFIIDFFYFKAQGIRLDTQNMIFSLGAEARYFPNEGTFASTYYRLAAGAGMFVVISETSELLIKALPYAAVGTGALFGFSPNFGMYAGVDYHIYIEGSTVISGFSPSLGLYLVL
jgi:hypothetical protein